MRIDKVESSVDIMKRIRPRPRVGEVCLRSVLVEDSGTPTRTAPILDELKRYLGDDIKASSKSQALEIGPSLVLQSFVTIQPAKLHTFVRVRRRHLRENIFLLLVTRERL